jgi:iron complex outermembrane receptor protein
MNVVSRKLLIARGVSSIAIVISGLAVSGAANAQAEVQQIAPVTSQQATSANESSTPETAPGDVVVTGKRAALEAADDRKRRSETIIDSVVADDAGKLPDNSITEVLQRVSGVSIVRFAALGDPDHFSVEGSGVQIRGLSGVASRLNGREIFSANNGRAILWGDVTPELMAAVDVYKASTADLIEGGTGGQIDLRTKQPFDFKPGLHIAGTANLSMGDLARKADPSASLMVSDRWHTGIGDIGVLADVAYSQFSSLSQFYRIEPYFKTRIGAKDYYIPGGFDYGDEAFQRKRSGIYGSVQWAPAKSLTFTGTFFQSRYKNQSSDYGAQVTSQSLAVDPATSTFDSNGGLISTKNLFNRDTSTFLPSSSQVTSSGNKGFVRSTTTTKDYSLSFVWQPEGSHLSLKGALQRVDSAEKYDRLDVFRDLGFGTGFGMDLSGDLPNITASPAAQASFANPSSYLWSASMPHNENNKGRLDAANLDAEYTFDDSFLRSIKIGGRYADRTERDYQNGYNWSALGRGWNGDPQLTYANAAPGDVAFHDFHDFFRGETNLPGNLMFASEDLVARMNRVQLTTPPPAGFCSAAQQYDCSASGPLTTTGYGGLSGIRQPGFVLPDDRVDFSTKTQAGYALARFGDAEGDGISGNVGVRVVHFKDTSNGYIIQNANTFVRNGQTLTLGQQSIARGGTASFTRALPSINLDYAPTSKTKVRFGYNITVDLPTFQALRGSGSIGVATTANPAGPNAPSVFTNFTADTGNPLLKPTMSNNFDLSFEYYLRSGTTFHIAPFYKRLTDLPIYALTQRNITVIYTNSTTENATAAATDYVNSTKAATVKGVEVGGRFFLDMLPGFLSGFGFEGNYTYIDSKNPGDIYRDINGVTHSDAPLVGLSKHNFNATLLYERKTVSARVAYSWRSKYLQTTNSNGTNQNYGYYAAPGAAPTQSIQIALPIYGDNYGSMDASVRFKVTKDFSFEIQGTNLLNSTQRTLMGGYPGGALYGRSWFQSDRRINTGINIAF